jgi:hypothetical protein
MSSVRSARKSRWWVAAAVVAATAASWPGLAATAAETPSAKKPVVVDSGPAGKVPAGFESWDALYTEQARLNKVADQLYLPAVEGYAGLVVAPESHEVRLYWKGRVPAAVASKAAAARTDVPVKVLSAAFSEKELAAEAGRWMKSGKDVTSAGPAADGSGVRIGIAGPRSAVTPSLPGVRSAVPVTVEYDSRPTPTYNRQDDTPAYFSGGSIGHCSLGFGITDNASGKPGFLTAAHCGSKGGAIYDGGDDFIGTFFDDLTSRDLGTIAGKSSASMFTGPFDSAASRRVGYRQRSYVGNWVSTSGAVTGELGGIQVTSAKMSVFYPGIGTVSPVVQGNQVNNGCAAAPGNSGGPVFAYAGGGDDRVVAKGIISAQTGFAVGCPGLSPNSGATSVLWVDIMDIAPLPVTLKFSS